MSTRPRNKRPPGTSPWLCLVLFCGPRLLSQEPAPLTVVTFDRELINWATPIEKVFELPPASVAVKKITLTISLDCPPGGCDPWDRGASIYVKGAGPDGKVESFEIARYVTPYGRGCAWDVDVTDYRIFLQGSTRLGCLIDTFIGGNQGWLVTLTFSFEIGAPARSVLSIQNLWQGRPVYGDPANPIASFFNERSATINAVASSAKLRFFVTGHGQGNTDNAAEFARKLHAVVVNGERFEHYLWRDNCDQNPCSPQGGTWQYARAGWCPGSVSDPWDVDISNVVSAGDTAAIRYQVEAYTNRCRPDANCRAGDCIFGNCDYDGGGHTPPIYWVESQLITYGNALGEGQTFVFEQGASGYSGTVDTQLSEASPAADRSRNPQLVVDADDPTGSRKATQVLLRFENLFGDGPGQIPPGAAIGRAFLELSSTSAGNGATVHRMMSTWDAAAGWSAYGGDGIQAGIEAQRDADARVSARAGGAIRIDVTPSLEAWSLDPCQNHGWALLPVGNDHWTFSSAEGRDPPRLVVVTRRITNDVVVAVGDEWRYFKGTRAPPADWSRPAFVPGAGWLRGATGIGYEDGDDATILTDMAGSYAAVFCRREFELPRLPTRLRLEIDYDDGFAAYLNGTEVVRSASLAPAGRQLTWNLLAASGREAGQVERYQLPLAALVPGRNVLAIQIHNSALDSSDLSLLPALIADYTLLASGETWRYLRGSSPLPAGWTVPGFDDGTWEVGRTGIGYGDGDDVTVLGDMRGVYGAVFCRRAFTIEDPAAVEGLALRLSYDDGVAVFLNGTEVERLNLPAGAVTPALRALGSIEPETATIALPPSLLVEGRNVLAVSVHNSSLDSSDLSFDAAIFQTLRAPPVDCSERFSRGDSDGNGLVNITDPVFTLGFLFLGGEAPGCADSADADDDGTLGLTDAVYTLVYLFLTGPPFPEPAAPACSTDPTPDELGCERPGCAGAGGI